MKRILHIVGSMNRGGVETWLMHVLRHIDRARFRMDFLVHTAAPGAFDDEIRALGSQVIPCLHPSRPLPYARRLSAVLQAGQYDVVHSHVHHFSGWVLRTAARARVPIRIAHSHTSTTNQDASLPRQAYLAVMKRWIRRCATHKLSASQLAAAALFGHAWEHDPRHHLIYYGIDLAPFDLVVDAGALRPSLGIPQHAFVVGHVGRFGPEKNHAFLIRIFQAVLERDSSAYCLLVGDGGLRAGIEQMAQDHHLKDRVIFAGVRGDVPRIMLGAMDCFLLPSLYEGLGIVLIEAQAASLPCVYSDVVPEEARILPSLVQTLSLSQPPDQWAEAVLACKARRNLIPRAEALNSVRQSRFNIEQSVQALERLYQL